MTPKYIIIHDSASKFGDVFQIDRWHRMRGFKWQDPRSGVIIHVGYHVVIYNGHLHSKHEYDAVYDGLAVPCRPYDVKGAHCIAKGMNSKSLGFCLIGEGDFSSSQMESLFELCWVACDAYNIPVENVLGHHEVDPRKSDPRFDINKFRKDLKDYFLEVNPEE